MVLKPTKRYLFYGFWNKWLFAVPWQYLFKSFGKYLLIATYLVQKLFGLSVYCTFERNHCSNCQATVLQLHLDSIKTARLVRWCQSIDDTETPRAFNCQRPQFAIIWITIMDHNPLEMHLCRRGGVWVRHGDHIDRFVWCYQLYFTLLPSLTCTFYFIFHYKSRKKRI